MDSSSQDGTDARIRRLCHDLRQYVSAAALLAGMPTDDDVPPEVQARLVKIGEALEVGSAMLDAQLRPPLAHKAPIDLAAVVEGCIRLLTATSTVPVVAELAGPAMVVGDEVQIRRAVGNLIDNAIRAAGQGGRVRVRVHNQDLHACVQVDDDGAGFGRVPPGNGQGMAVVSSVLHNVHGRLEIASGPGPGTTIRMLIPVQREPGADS
jgi:signal transduction histidine kinase